MKAVHLELVTDLTFEAFIASLKRFISRRGPSLTWSDNGTNFVGELKDLYQFLQRQSTQDDVSHYLSDKMITWKFIPQRTPQHLGSSSQIHEDSFETDSR